MKPAIFFKIGLIVGLSGSSALAVSTAAAAENQRQEIEEVIVTATKRKASVQDVPLAVTAISAEKIERAGVKDLRDLSTVATSFNMNSTQTESQGTTLRVRGGASGFSHASGPWPNNSRRHPCQRFVGRTAGRRDAV